MIESYLRIYDKVFDSVFFRHAGTRWILYIPIIGTLLSFIGDSFPMRIRDSRKVLILTFLLNICAITLSIADVGLDQVDVFKALHGYAPVAYMTEGLRPITKIVILISRAMSKVTLMLFWIILSVLSVLVYYISRQFQSN